VLIRRAGYAVGLFDGPELLASKVGSRHIHGRTAAGGWSQKRYARRRANQADEIVEAAARAADRILSGGADRSPARPAPQTGPFPGQTGPFPSQAGPFPSQAGPFPGQAARLPGPAGSHRLQPAAPALQAAGPPRFLVTGGDRPLVAAVLGHACAAIAAMPVAAHLGIGTPVASVLTAAPDRVLAVRIDLREP